MSYLSLKLKLQVYTSAEGIKKKHWTALGQLIDSRTINGQFAYMSSFYMSSMS